VKPGVAAFLAAAALPLVACGCSSNAHAEWVGPPRPDDSGRLEIGAFNAHLDASGKGVAPVVVATEFLRLDRAHADTTSIVAQASGEGSGPATVTVTLDGLPDDSVQAQRFVLGLSQNGDGDWRLTSAETAQRCRPGRGHQAFSPAPCL
jgi:hypothetical protein